MTPPQVDTALAEIEHTAFYLRYNQDRGRYYASLDASINRALEDIRSSLKEEQAKDHLAALARSMVKNDNTFQVVHDVSLPEHVPDKSDRPILGVISLDTEQIDAEAFVTTVGPNRPRLQQNFVFLLVPRTVHIQGEVWNEDRVNRTRDTWNQLIELAREVLARRKLRDKPENFGIRSEQLAQEKFEQKTKERELALLTNLTELYDGVWFPGSSGQVVGKEIRAGVGHISQQLYEVLDKEGELVTEVRARTQEALISLGKLFFQVSETPTLNRLREEFKIARRWPVLESSAVFDMVIREGISRDHWCLFRLHSEESIKPDIFYDRKNPLPFALDLQQEGLAIITPQGAKKRGWDDEGEVNPKQVETWVRDAIAEEPAGYVTGILRRLEDKPRRTS